ncbi:MAG: TVP38/TMEM64 family protein [Candidatus Acidiferrales bacterium]
MAQPDKLRLRNIARTIWLSVLLGGLYLYFFHRDSIQSQLGRAFSYSLIVGYLVYLLLGCVRGFTLIPATYLVVTGLLFFPPVPLFVLSLVGILVSSSIIYFFSEALHLDEFFERKHADLIARTKRILQRNELPIVIGWSFFPLVPTDLICYLCGTLEVDFRKLLLGVFIGEGTICAIYIFLGGHLLRFLLPGL